MTLADPDLARLALLPAGLSDLLPAEAEHQAHVIEKLMAAFTAQGYERVEPPLVEFEDSLLATATQSITNQTFRLMDPVSQRMMGVRADLTLQVARIAASRLGHRPRPLRLAYAGDVLRVKGSQLRPERQFVQCGVELIGVDCVAADVEIIRLAADALRDLGLKGLTVDLNAAPLVQAVCDAHGISGAAAAALRAALDRKDASEVASLAGPAADALAGLLAATGPARAVMPLLAGLDLPPRAHEPRQRLLETAAQMLAALPDLVLTIDPVENRGFEYYTGVGFTLFARNVRGEIGRGGRYVAGDGEAGCGVSMFLDSVLRALPPLAPVPRMFLPFGTAHGVGHALRQQGYVTIAGLAPVSDLEAEARRLGCDHVLSDGRVVEVGRQS